MQCVCVCVCVCERERERERELASLHLVELTVPFETTIKDAVTRKRARYSELLCTGVLKDCKGSQARHC